jgi:L-ascorbate metabolism protein UlaG (beta-lactamase superfamily)
MRLTYYGQSCVGVHTAGKHLLFDPAINANPLAQGKVDIHTIPADLLLLTHGHGDHTWDAEAILKRTGATLLSNFEIVEWYAAKGITNGVHMNLGGSTTVGDLRIKYVKAVHSSMLPDGSYGGNPGGFVVTGPEGSFHHAGDTALTLDMQLLKRFDLKFACLPIGDTFTMGIDDAVEAAQYMGVKVVVGIHYDSFPPIRIDHDHAKATFRKAGIELHLPAIGESIDL